MSYYKIDLGDFNSNSNGLDSIEAALTSAGVLTTTHYKSGTKIIFKISTVDVVLEIDLNLTSCMKQGTSYVSGSSMVGAVEIMRKQFSLVGMSLIIGDHYFVAIWKDYNSGGNGFAVHHYCVVCKSADLVDKYSIQFCSASYGISNMPATKNFVAVELSTIVKNGLISSSNHYYKFSLTFQEVVSKVYIPPVAFKNIEILTLPSSIIKTAFLIYGNDIMLSAMYGKYDFGSPSSSVGYLNYSVRLLEGAI